MYEEFYQFREKPFALTPDPEFLYLSKAHKRAFAYLEYGVQDPSGFVCITGEIGAGKTTLIRTFLNSLDNRIKVARLFNTKISSRQLLQMILQDFGLEYSGQSKTEMISTLNRYLLDTFAHGKRGVLIIDEAQNLSTDLLEEVRLLSNLETEKAKLLQIILVGQSELRENLLLPTLEQLRQRITVNYHMAPLEKRETAAYVRHRLKVAAKGPAVTFPEPVLDIIHKYSGGVPRLINVICDTLLLYGYVAERRDPDVEMMKEVVRDMIQERTLNRTSHTEPMVLRDQGKEVAKPPTDSWVSDLRRLDQRLQSLEQREDLYMELFEIVEHYYQEKEKLAEREEKLKAKEAKIKKEEKKLRELLRQAKE